MHIVVIDGTNPLTATLAFSQALEWRTNNITHLSYWSKTLDWSAPGFLKIEPEQRNAIPEGMPPGPTALWIPLASVVGVFQVPDGQPMPMQASSKMH